MTLQPPSGYQAADEPGDVPAPQPISPPLPAADTGARSAQGLAPDSPVHDVVAPVHPSSRDESQPDPMPPTPVPAAGIPAPSRSLSSPPIGLEVVGGQKIRLRKAVALDRIASGYGFLTITWNQRRQGLDLLALSENSSVTTRGSSIAIDLSQPLTRVLVGTGTRGTLPLPPSELVLANGATQVVVPILGGTSLGVWPRLSISRVDEFLVVRHELDPLSGVLSAVAGAYGYDERTFVLAHTT